MAAGNQIFSVRGYVFPNGRPEPGDVIVSRSSRPAGSFALGISGVPPQLICRTWEDALGRALRFAKQERVSVWTIDDKHRLTAVARYRMVTRVEARPDTLFGRLVNEN